MAKLILNDTTVGLGREFKPSDGMWFTVKHPVGKAGVAYGSKFGSALGRGDQPHDGAGDHPSVLWNRLIPKH